MTKIKADMIDDDPLIEALVGAKGKMVEIIAFGILYVGILKKIDINNGTIQISNGDDNAVLEIERIESFRLTS
jgi:hypothetical protein